MPTIVSALMEMYINLPQISPTYTLESPSQLVISSVLHAKLREHGSSFCLGCSGASSGPHTGLSAGGQCGGR